MIPAIGINFDICNGCMNREICMAVPLMRSLNSKLHAIEEGIPMIRYEGEIQAAACAMKNRKTPDMDALKAGDK